ncbi:MAG TPA: hypothetical protein DEP51_05595 [Clostridiales bacterium]|nr:hypothetical protein [Clostridiales bacterium]
MEVKPIDIGYMAENTTTALVPYQDVSLYKSKIKRKIERISKRGIDIVGGIAGTLLLIPLTAILFIANYVSNDNGPLFYTQKRIGKNGKVFKMYKFRSMCVGADEKLKNYLEENEEARKEYKKYKKLKHDPRVTKIGEFIRKTSLDEFPQFINILKGDMSLVGPRPYLEREKEEMTYYYKYIVSCRPGLTGYWQIAGRSNVTFEDRLHMDMDYYRKHTLKTDMKILKKTVEKCVKKEGAL